MDGAQDVIPIFWVGTAIMLFLTFGLIFLVVFYQGNLAKIKRAEAEQLLRVSIESEQQERMRIAADLHDGVCGDLSAIKYYLALLEKQPSSSAEVLREIRDGIDNALDNTRMVSYKLMPPLLESVGLAAALDDNFERLSARTGIAFKCEGQWTLGEQAVNYEIFRVIQEFTTNMIKYGGISRCCVSVSGSDAGGTIDITDDGKPYDFEALSSTSKGSGLANISSRLRAIDAKLIQHPTQAGNHFSIKLHA